MLSAFVVLAGVIFLDIILSGDNAVVIGMAANTLAEKQRNRAIAYGMGLAALTRIILSLSAISLLRYRFISIIGGLALFWVVYRLIYDILYKKEGSETKVRKSDKFWYAIGLIVIADVSMSLDNILAIAGMARNNPVIMAIGLVVSISVMAFAAKLASKMLERWKWANWVGVFLIIIIAIELIAGIKNV